MYKFGQFRRTQMDNYINLLALRLQEVQRRDTVNSSLKFHDKVGTLSGTNIISASKCYYLRFGVKQRSDGDQVIELSLRDSTSEDKKYSIETYKVDQGEGISYFEAIFVANASYDKLYWVLERNLLDYSDLDNPDKEERIVEIVEPMFGELIDVIPFLQASYPGLEYLTKIGVQGDPYLLMCINDEPIRVGRTGIYELKGEVNISSLYFIPRPSSVYADGYEYFIMDFEY